MKQELQGYRKNLIKILTALFLLFPWITYLKILKYNDAEASIFGGYSGLSLDFFLYYKEMVLIFAAATAVFWFIGERIFPDKVDNDVPMLKSTHRWLFLLSGIFIGWTVLSVFFAEQKKNALWGSPTEGEGLWTLVSYIILILAFYNYFSNVYGLSLMKKAIGGLSAIAIVLSVIEYFYQPLLEIELVQKLIAPASYTEILSTIESNSFGDAVALTFYNPSYYGGFVCLLIPFMLVFGLQAQKLMEQMIYGILMAGLFFCVVASNSTTALYVAILEILLVAVVSMIFSANKKVMAVKCGCFGGGLLVAAVLVNVISGNALLGIFTNANSATGNVVEERFSIQDIVLEDNSVILIGKKAQLTIRYDNGQMVFLNDEQEVLSPKYEEGTITFAEPEYHDIEVYLTGTADIEGVKTRLVVDAGYADTIDFFILDDGRMSGVGQSGAIITDIGDAGTPEFLKKYYGLFTGRGYAWANSLPILKETILIGKGPGNFAYHFKQNDYTGMLTTHESTKYIIDKPHNAYLQYAINTGLPGAIAFFGIFAAAMVQAARMLWKNKNGDMQAKILLMGGMTAIAGFLVYSAINDSIITVTPVICMLTGLVLAAGDFLQQGTANYGKASKKANKKTK